VEVEVEVVEAAVVEEEVEVVVVEEAN